MEAAAAAAAAAVAAAVGRAIEASLRRFGYLEVLSRNFFYSGKKGEEVGRQGKLHGTIRTVLETEQYKHTLLPPPPHNIFFRSSSTTTFHFFPFQIRELFCQRRKKKKTFLISSAADFEGINILVLPLPIPAFSCAHPKKKDFPYLIAAK